MLIKFSIISGQSVEMFEKDAQAILHAMDLSGTVPSAISAEDIPAAIQHLENTLSSSSIDKDDDKPNQDGGSEDSVGTKTKAFPLIELLKNAVKQNKSVMWDKV